MPTQRGEMTSDPSEVTRGPRLKWQSAVANMFSAVRELAPVSFVTSAARPEHAPPQHRCTHRGVAAWWATQLALGRGRLATLGHRQREGPVRSAPGLTRTGNPRLRRPVLYPVELRAQIQTEGDCMPCGPATSQGPRRENSPHCRWKPWEGFHAFPRSGSGGQSPPTPTRLPSPSRLPDEMRLMNRTG